MPSRERFESTVERISFLTSRRLFVVWATNDDRGIITPHAMGDLPLRIVLVTYEFTFSPFSGNGILSCSLVKSLLQQGCHVTVWCCRPESSTEDLLLEVSKAHLQDTIVTTIPKQLGWRRLDRGSAWEHFSWDSLNESDQGRLQHAVSTADVICPIDWTGSLAWQSTGDSKKPVLYLNFRVFGSGMASEREWYNEMEKRALDRASFVVALSENDKQSLCELTTDKKKPVRVLLPPLRGDVKELACLEHDDLQAHLKSVVATTLTDRRRRYLVTCIARLSPEKNVENFCHFVSANRVILDEYGFVPLLAGSTADEEYARRIKDQLRRAVPHAIVIDSFLSPKELASVFTITVLNFHPCEYDAFGMTIIEAAAFSVPSIVAANGAVGASAIVGNGASIEVDMNQCFVGMASILGNQKGLTEVGEEAKRRAFSWDEEAYGKQLLEYIHDLLYS